MRKTTKNSISTQPTSCSSSVAPRIIMICRSYQRKAKKIDYIGESHLDWIQKLGAIPILLPRTLSTYFQLSHFLPMDGLLLVEGEDISPEYKPYGSNRSLDDDMVASVCQTHPSDACHDCHKDKIEWSLLEKAREQNIPILGICRGCQLINVAYGGTLYYDLAAEVPNAHPHISYDHYDDYRHSLKILPNTPLAKWYEHEKIDRNGNIVIEVNSYHHQGVRRLSPSLQPMAFSTDGVIEGLYDPLRFSPEEGLFCVGIQFHPERLGDQAHHGGGLRVYESFVTAARNFAKRRKGTNNDLRNHFPLKLPDCNKDGWDGYEHSDQEVALQ